MTSSRGPRPTHTAPTLSRARARVLRAVADAASEGPVTLAQLAEVLGGHPNTTRQHLDALVAAGFVSMCLVPKRTPGRRPQGFTPTDLGRRALGGDIVTDEYHGMVEAFATYLVRSEDPDREARAVGQIWGAGQAEGIEPGSEPAEALVELLDILGFEPRRLATDEGETALVLRACPLLGLVDGHPEVMCELHRGMVDGVMQRLGTAEGVRLEPFCEPDGCRLRLA